MQTHAEDGVGTHAAYGVCYIHQCVSLRVHAFCVVVLAAGHPQFAMHCAQHCRGGSPPAPGLGEGCSTNKHRSKAEGGRLVASCQTACSDSLLWSLLGRFRDSEELAQVIKGRHLRLLRPA